MGLICLQAGGAPPSSVGEVDMNRARSPEPLDFFIWTVEVPPQPTFRYFYYLSLPPFSPSFSLCVYLCSLWIRYPCLDVKNALFDFFMDQRVLSLCDAD
jgi:hypothetical protein